ncbi:GNAT family N-acetyltransferase [Gulosibacter sediminis]|uniref:GNAT family N-acetyltransferase n=1 Tax=Gulosibacter sediminis TaxID=1729695 RepID=UPI001867EA08|nr:GNAT family N-acetyltransferase [Gulosibacter sediminis]
MDIEWLVELRAEVLRADLARLGAFDEHRVRERMRAAFRPQNTQVIVVDGADAGSISLREEQDARWIEHFCLAPSAQNRGIGSAVLEQVLPTKDPRSFKLNVLQGSPARRLYERFGFAACEQDEVDGV